MATKKENIFDQLSKINISGKTDKKGKFTYLSWAFAWAELMKVAPTANAHVYEDPTTNMPYFSSSAGVMIKVGVTINEVERICYLPVMNFKNQAMKIAEVNMMDINKTIQRATVKAIALHGLGLYIYAGEDLPEDDKELAELKMRYFSLLKEHYNNKVPQDEIELAKKMSKEEMNQAITEIKLEVNK